MNHHTTLPWAPALSPRGLTMGQGFQALFALAGSFAPPSSSPVLLAMSAVVPMALPAQWHPNPHIQSSMTWMEAEGLWRELLLQKESSIINSKNITGFVPGTSGMIKVYRLQD